MTVNEENFVKATVDFLRTIRASQSQESLSLELGFNFNIVNRWENCKRGFYWEDFIALARLKKINVPQALSQVCYFDFSSMPTSVEVLEKILIPSTSELLLKHYSRAKLNRLRDGDTKLLFSDFLIIIHLLFARDERFLNLLRSQLGNQDSGGVSDEYIEKRSNILNSLVRLGLSLDAYKNANSPSSELLADILHLRISTVDKCLDDLLSLGLIYRDGEFFRPLRDSEDPAVLDKRVANMQSRRWRRKICAYADRHVAKSDGLLSGNLLFTSNKKVDERVSALCRQFYMDLKNLVGSIEEGEPEEQIRYVELSVYGPLYDEEFERE